MWMKIVGIILISLLLVLSNLGVCSAGPYFNIPRKEIAGDSREAVRLLSEARIVLIRMLTDLDDGKLDKALTERAEALKLLKEANTRFKNLETKVPNQPLKYAPKTDDDKKVLDEFNRLLEIRRLEIPKTEKQLANLAVVIVERYMSDIEKADLTNFPKNWKGVRAIILSEINLLAIGNLVSIAWIISEP